MWVWGRGRNRLMTKAGRGGGKKEQLVDDQKNWWTTKPDRDTVYQALYHHCPQSPNYYCTRSLPEHWPMPQPPSRTTPRLGACQSILFHHHPPSTPSPFPPPDRHQRPVRPHLPPPGRRRSAAAAAAALRRLHHSYRPAACTFLHPHHLCCSQQHHRCCLGGLPACAVRPYAGGVQRVGAGVCYGGPGGVDAAAGASHGCVSLDEHELRTCWDLLGYQDPNR